MKEKVFYLLSVFLVTVTTYLILGIWGLFEIKNNDILLFKNKIDLDFHKKYSNSLFSFSEKILFFVVVVCKQPLNLDKMSRSGHLITNDDPVRCALTGIVRSTDKLGLLLHEVIVSR